MLGQRKVAMIKSNHLTPTPKLYADSPIHVIVVRRKSKGWGEESRHMNLAFT